MEYLATEDWQPPAPPEGMAALPPNPQLPSQMPTIIFTHGQKRPPTITEFLHQLAATLIANLIGIAVAAVVVRHCWNALTWLSTLPDLGWGTTFTALVLLRVFALIVRL